MNKETDVYLKLRAMYKNYITEWKNWCRILNGSKSFNRNIIVKHKNCVLKFYFCWSVFWKSTIGYSGYELTLTKL